MQSRTTCCAPAVTCKPRTPQLALDVCRRPPKQPIGAQKEMAIDGLPKPRVIGYRDAIANHECGGLRSSAILPVSEQSQTVSRPSELRRASRMMFRQQSTYPRCPRHRFRSRALRFPCWAVWAVWAVWADGVGGGGRFVERRAAVVGALPALLPRSWPLLRACRWSCWARR